MASSTVRYPALSMEEGEAVRVNLGTRAMRFPVALEEGFRTIQRLQQPALVAMVSSKVPKFQDPPSIDTLYRSARTSRCGCLTLFCGHFSDWCYEVI